MRVRLLQLMAISAVIAYVLVCATWLRGGLSDQTAAVVFGVISLVSVVIGLSSNRIPHKDSETVHDKQDFQ